MLRQLGPIFQSETDKLVKEIKDAGHRLERMDDLDPLLEEIGDTRYVLLGEASHGTSEYYTWRAKLSRRLIEEKGFSFIAVEGDWPDCYEINRYSKGYEESGETAVEVLHNFERWPTWMWANWEIAALAEWLRAYNADQPENLQVGFYGLDVYSLWESMEEVMGYLETYAPDSVDAARRAFLCFEPYGRDVQEYARSTALVPEGCEQEVVSLLQEVRNQVRSFPGDPEADFNAKQNAFVTAEAERYYRAMVRGGANSWNVRDYHMADTLDRLMAHHEQVWGAQPKAIVWEHNTHVGDARYTDMSQRGMVNTGQLTRERHEAEGVILVGFGSYEGSVIAGSEWGAPMQRMNVPRGKDGSWEQVLHQAGGNNRLLLLQALRGLEAAEEWRGHRAIGVVYHPEYEWGNYVPTLLPRRYDAFLFIDKTEALHPLQLQPERDQPPELYPWGF